MIAGRLAPPYDVISPAERSELAARDPANVVHVILPEPRGPLDRYAAGAALLAEWRSRGVLLRDAEPAAYVHQTRSALPDATGSVVRTGVFLAASAEPFAAGRVRPHERTHAAPKEDRRRLLAATGTNLSPVFLLAPDEAGDLAAMLRAVTEREPRLFCETLAGEHALWVVGDEAAAELAEAAGREPVYVADGHHRYETAVGFAGEAPAKWRLGAERVLAYVVSFRDGGLAILPTHRIVVGRPIAANAFVAAAGAYLSPVVDRADAVIAVFAGGVEVPLAVRAEAAQVLEREAVGHPLVRSLGVWQADAIAITLVAARLLGAAPAVRYTPDAAEARSTATRGECALSLLVPACRLADMRAVADAGEVMPPKSTYFAPKVPSGLVFRPLAEAG